MPKSKATKKPLLAVEKQRTVVKNVRIRFEDELHARIRQAARETGRSFNGYVVWAAKQTLEAAVTARNHGR